MKKIAILSTLMSSFLFAQEMPNELKKLLDEEIAKKSTKKPLNKAEITKLKYSNTQVNLDDRLQQMKGVKSMIGIDWTKLKLPAHPDNVAEAAYLESLQKQLTAKRIERIKEQVDFNYTYFYGLEYFESRPELVKLCQMVSVELLSVILDNKLEFDRVRPSYVNQNLKLVIPNPEHPAYPSGHATQSALFSFIFSSLDSANAQKFIDLGKEIALNREYAGVHYRSDSYIGQTLAKAMIKELVKNDTFKGMFFAAANEGGSSDDEALLKLKLFQQFSSSK